MASNTGKNTDNLKEPWKKGQSGNPKGRPKGSRNFKTLYWEAITRIAESQGTTPEEFEVKMIEQAVRKGFNGDKSFYTDTLDRVHGKAMQSIDHTTNGKELPAPIISLDALRRDNSTPQDSKAGEKD